RTSLDVSLRRAALTCHSLRSEGPNITSTKRRREDRGGAPCRAFLRSRCEMPQHILQNAAVLEVFQLIQSIDPADQGHPLEAAVAGHDLGDHALMRLELAVQAADGYRLIALEPQRLP